VIFLKEILKVHPGNNCFSSFSNMVLFARPRFFLERG
jgi:hypothetical protein